MYLAISLPASDSTAEMPPSESYCSSDLRRTSGSRPIARNTSRVRRWKCAARGWIAVPPWRSTASERTPWKPRNAAIDSPTMLPPAIRTGTLSSAFIVKPERTDAGRNGLETGAFVY